MRLFALKYVSPIRYMGTKLFANAIYSTLNSPRMPRVPDICRAQPIARERVPTFKYDYRKSPIYVPAPTAPIKEREYVPYVERPYVPRPAAVKRNGGLRGSSATKAWRR